MWVGTLSVGKKIDPNPWLLSYLVLPIAGHGVCWNRWSLTRDMFDGLPDWTIPANPFNWLLPVGRRLVKEKTDLRGKVPLNVEFITVAAIHRPSELQGFLIMIHEYGRNQQYRGSFFQLEDCRQAVIGGGRLKGLIDRNGENARGFPIEIIG